MTVILSALLGGVVVSIAGFAMLLLTSPGFSRRVLPAAPVIGVAYFVVALHLIGMILPMSVGIWVALAPPVGIIAYFLVRRRARLALGRSAWTGLATVAVLGAGAATVALLPQILLGTTGIVQLTHSNDAFYYVTMSDWLAGHTIFTTPEIDPTPSPGGASPAYGDVPVALLWGLRLGQELLGAGIASMVGLSASAAFPGMVALWVALLPSAGWALGSAFSLGRPALLALAATVGVLPSTLHQVVNHNADSLLGSSLALLTIALVASSLGNRARPAPIWLSAMSLAAVVGTYTEYLPFLGVVLVAVVLIRPRAELGRAVVRAGTLVGLAILIAPLVWIRAVRSILVVAGVAAVPGSDDHGVFANVVRVFQGLPGGLVRDLPGGAGPILTAIGWACAVLILVGVAAGVLVPRTRSLAVGAMLASGVAIYLAVRSGDYVAGRAVDMLSPLLLGAGIVGWDAVLRSRGSLGLRRIAAGLGAAVIAAAVATTGLLLVRGERAALDGARVVDGEYPDLAEWATRAADRDGFGTAVATPAFFEQLWSSDALRNLKGVGYVTLRGDLGYRGDTTMEDHWDGSLPRVVITGPGTFVADDGAITDRSGTFSRVDFTAGTAVIAVPEHGDVSWSWASGDPVAGSSGGSVLILSNRGSLEGCVLDVTSDAPLTLGQGAGVAETGGLGLDNVPLIGGVARVRVERAGGAGPIMLEGMHCAS